MYIRMKYLMLRMSDAAEAAVQRGAADAEGGERKVKRPVNAHPSEKSDILSAC